jgi:hypothetical protein
MNPPQTNMPQTRLSASVYIGAALLVAGGSAVLVTVYFLIGTALNMHMTTKYRESTTALNDLMRCNSIAAYNCSDRWIDFDNKRRAHEDIRASFLYSLFPGHNRSIQTHSNLLTPLQAKHFLLNPTAPEQ